MVALGVAGLAALVAGVAVALTVQSLLGPLLIVGGVLAIGRVAFAVGLTGLVQLLATGTLRRR